MNEHDHEKQSEGFGMNTDRASGWEHPLATWRPTEPEQREGRITRQERPVPPGDRLAHLGRVEHPVQTYAVMKPVPNSLPEPADTEKWLKSFAAAAPHLPPTIDLDAQSSIVGQTSADSSVEPGSRS
ncbi:hypothetical protein ABT246_25745 [Streptomyces sp. NPDC001553]|uniref:hypothetical protein n=1 Tax=Streptomyces sp. NPDC001553 TaxID=3154385 RepID=UPI00332E8F75